MQEKISFLPGIRRGVTAILGSGGKTTLMLTLAARLPGRVIVTTTTRILPPDGLRVCDPQTRTALEEAMCAGGPICVGAPCGEKLRAGALPVETLAAACDYLLVEADGSRGLPLKAHAPHEPVIPPAAGQRLLVVGMSGVGRPICEAAHRSEIFARLAGCGEAEAASPARVARVLRAEGLYDTVILNQAADCLPQARELASLLDAPVFAGEIREGKLRCL